MELSSDSEVKLVGPSKPQCGKNNADKQPLSNEPNHMLRQYLCQRFRPKCIFTFLLVLIVLSVSIAMIMNMNHDSGHSRDPINYSKHHKKPEDQTLSIDLLYKDDVYNNIVSQGTERDSKRDGHVSHKGKLHKGKYGNRNRSVNAEIYGERQAENVLLLLKKMKPPSTNKPVSKKVLNAYVDFLYQVIVKDVDRERPPLTFEPQCTGGIKEGEVEDILCIPRPKFLDNVKNPCWYSESVRGDRSFLSSPRQLHCLPYFHILGCAKSGTTDLWNRLIAHPHIISNDGLLHKEALFWSWNRFGVYGRKRGNIRNFSSYVNTFQDVAMLIQSSLTNNNNYHKILITGDASPPDFWDFRGWRNISQNRGLSFPQVLTPHLMKHMYPDPKFILMFRDPIERMYSDYFFMGGGLTSEDFHRDIVQSVIEMAGCVRKHDLSFCFFDDSLYKELKVRLAYGCYSVFMREWLRVFPLKHFMFIKTEDYTTKPEKTLQDIIKFLGLTPLKKKALKDIAEEERSRITVQKQVAGPMKPKTKALLSRLFSPCVQSLAKMIERPDMVWN